VIKISIMDVFAVAHRPAIVFSLFDNINFVNSCLSMKLVYLPR